MAGFCAGHLDTGTSSETRTDDTAGDTLDNTADDTVDDNVDDNGYNTVNIVDNTESTPKKTCLQKQFLTNFLIMCWTTCPRHVNAEKQS